MGSLPRKELDAGLALSKATSTLRWGILALFFVSGAPALLYQIIWQRHLCTLFGAHSESVAIIVGAFMLGLGIGSLVGGEVSARSTRSPFVLFAVIECLIAVFGFFSLNLFDAVGRATGSFGLFGGGVASFCLVVVPTIAMGATLPVLANALIARVGNVGVSVGSLYFVNTLGSAVAAGGSLFLFHAGVGQRGAVLVAVALNVAVVAGALCLAWVTRDLERKGAAEAPAPATDTPAPAREQGFAAALSFCSGFLALSVELVWFRIVYLYCSGRAFAFPLALAWFLLGIAFGSLAASRLMRAWAAADAARLRNHASAIMLLSGVAVSLAVCAAAFFAGRSQGGWIIVITGVLGLPLGLIFPVLMHAGVLPGSGAGRSVSHVYAANIAGSVAGSVGTGFALFQVLPLRTLVLLLSLLALAIALYLRRGSATRFRIAAALAVVLCGSGWVFSENLFERLQFGQASTDGRRFTHVVENRSGVIAVTADDLVYGGGVYDGHFSVGLAEDRNYIIRPYSLTAFRPAPARILVIGLASGSWVQVLASLPSQPRLDVVEINPGYLELIPRYPVVASLIDNPRVHMIIEDARRWLTRNPDEKYDLIVMNTSYHWRVGSTNLLSREFLELLRAHLVHGGIAIYNTTSSSIVNKTGISVFPYAWRVLNALVVSDEPMPIDRDRLLETLRAYRVDGKPVLEPDNEKHAEVLARIAGQFDPAQTFNAGTLLEPRESMLPRFEGVPVLTDDNMLIEWQRILPE